MGENKYHTRLLLTETKDLLLRQLKDVEAIDTKASIILGADALLLTAGSTIFINLPPLQSVNERVSILVTVSIFLSFAFLLTSFILALVSYRVASYKETINPRAAANAWVGRDETDVLTEYLDTLIDAYEKNVQSIDLKVQRFNWSLWCLAASVCLTSIVAFIYFLSA